MSVAVPSTGLQHPALHEAAPLAYAESLYHRGAELSPAIVRPACDRGVQLTVEEMLLVQRDSTAFTSRPGYYKYLLRSLCALCHGKLTMMTLTSSYIHYPIVRKLERLELRQGRLESIAGGSTRREQVHAQLQRSSDYAAIIQDGGRVAKVVAAVPAMIHNSMAHYHIRREEQSLRKQMKEAEGGTEVEEDITSQAVAIDDSDMLLTSSCIRSS